MPINKYFTKAIERNLAWDKYQKIQANYTAVTLNGSASSDEDFRKNFNYYYKIRRSENWRDTYYDYFEKNKKSPSLKFDDILDFLRSSTNRVEASFASKMLATINPDMPIIDSQVLKNLGLSLDDKLMNKSALKLSSTAGKMDIAKAVYAEVCKRYKDYKLKNPTGYNNALNIFDTYFPDYTWVSSTKKIDYFLWSCTKSELKSMGCFLGLI